MSGTSFDPDEVGRAYGETPPRPDVPRGAGTPTVTKKTEPRFTAQQGVYTCSWGEPIDVTFEFDMLRTETRTGDLTGEVTVRLTRPGFERTLHQARVTLTGTQSRATLAKHLHGRAAELELDWHGLLEDATLRTIAAYRAGDSPLVLRDAPAPEVAGWLLPPLALARHPVVLYGDGGTGKSYIALAAALSIHADRDDLLGIAPTAARRVAYLDWEFDAWEHRERMRRLVGERMPDLVYVRCAVPLREQVDRLRRMIRDEEIEFLVVDSVGAACGGEPESAEVALRFFEALRILGLGSLCIAHSPKQGSDDYPFGSVFWHNNARATWLTKKEQGHGSAGFTLGLFNKKSNSGPLSLPLGFELTFGPDTVRIERRDVRDVPELAANLPLKTRIAHVLKRGPKTYAEVALALECDADSVSRVVRRYEGRLFTRAPSPDGLLRWALVYKEAGQLSGVSGGQST